MSLDQSTQTFKTGYIDIDQKASRVAASDRDDVKKGSNNHIVPIAPPNDIRSQSDLPFQGLSAGSQITIYGYPTEIKTTGMEIRDSDRYGFNRFITKFGFDDKLIGTTSQLYIDREPYLLNVVNGPVWEIDPSDVSYSVE
jgi:hypothetical protein